MDAKKGVKPIIFCGPSGSGKSTLIKRLMEKYPDCFAFSVSHTTREPRPGETDGVDYHFVSREDLQKMVENKEFLETAEFSGNCYGTSMNAVNAVLKTGRICLLDVDIQGVQTVKMFGMNARFLFVKPPDLETLEKRLRSRATEDEEKLQLRLESAKKEMEYSDRSDLFDAVIVNDDLDTAFGQLEDLLKEDIDFIHNKE